MANATPAEIESFFVRCRKLIDSSFVLYKNKPENKLTLIELGYTYKNVKDEIRNLSIENYSEGPSPDHHSLDEIWVFGMLINQREIYIKLQLSHFNNPGELIDTLYCMSFHFADRCLNYPYKK